MREKTAEEKLREELEGKLSEAPHQEESGKPETVKRPVKPRAMRSRAFVRKPEKPVNVGQRVDSFMEDFERRIAESLNAEKTFSVRRSGDERKAAEESFAESEVVQTAVTREPAKKAVVGGVRRKRRTAGEAVESLKQETIERDVLGVGAVAESFEPVQAVAPEISQPTPEISQPIPDPVQPETPEIARPIPDPVQADAPEISQPILAPEQPETPEIARPILEPEQADTPEISQPIPDPVQADTLEISQPILAPEQPDAPEISQPILAPEQPDAPEISQPIPDPVQADTPEIARPILEPEQPETPEISQPILAPEQADTPEISQPILEPEQPDFPVEIINTPNEDIDNVFPDIPVIDAQEISESSDDSQENTLPDIPVISPEHENTFDNFADISPFDDFTENPEESPQVSPPAENNTDFPPFADVVVNVDADLPQIHSNSPENFTDDLSNTENEAAPVTVTMPESTKTAEDKLMANIAEAMTGSPLTLDKPDPSEPYRLPENLLNPQIDPNSSPQSAEDKLIADISQAISESPIKTAQDQANQNFEADISPFDEMPLPEPIQTPDFDDNYDQERDEEHDDEEGDDFDEPFLPDFPAETEQPQQQPQQEDSLLDEVPDPFSIMDDEDIPDSQDNTDADTDTDSAEDTEDLSEDFSELPVAENDTADVEENIIPDFSLLNAPENEPEPVNLEKTPEPESETLLDQDKDPESESEPQPVTAEDRLAQELADFQNQEQSLLDEPDTPQSSDDDPSEDFNFMASWGDAADTMNYGDDEPDSQEQTPESQEIFSQPEIPTPHVEPAPRITPAPTAHTSPTEPEFQDAPKSSPVSSPIWRILLQAVLGLLILAGVFSLFKLHQLTDTITGMMLYGSTQSGISAQSYDYAVDLIPDSEISSRMRLRGIEGWKLVGSRRTQDSATGQYGYEFIFMRQKPANL